MYNKFIYWSAQQQPLKIMFCNIVTLWQNIIYNKGLYFYNKPEPMWKICKIKKENDITQEDDACSGVTNNIVYENPILIPGNSLKSW